jgi:hypothetical protein
MIVRGKLRVNREKPCKIRLISGIIWNYIVCVYYFMQYNIHQEGL